MAKYSLVLLVLLFIGCSGKEYKFTGGPEFNIGDSVYINSTIPSQSDTIGIVVNSRYHNKSGWLYEVLLSYRVTRTFHNSDLDLKERFDWYEDV